METQVRYLIIGGGTAGQSAAQAIRSMDAEGRVMIAAGEEELPYNRPMLTKLLEQDIPRDKLLIKKESWYQEKKIDIRTGLKILSIDPQKHSAAAMNGETIIFDKLIFAAGASCFVPPIPGADQSHVFTVRTTKDVRRIKDRLPAVRHAAVIGGGVLGLEIAWSLTRYGIAVSVIEQGERVMQRQLDQDASALMLSAIESHGTRFLTSSGAKEITEKGVILLNGTEIPADMVMISTGIVSATGLAKTIPGIGIGRAIQVNEYMETGVEHIYACGDCAELNGRVFGLWQPSGQMGQTAGRNAAGDRRAFEAQANPMLFNGYETSLCVVGDAGYGQGDYETVTLVKTETELEKLWFRNGLLAGAAMVGDTKKSAFYKKAVSERRAKENLPG